MTQIQLRLEDLQIRVTLSQCYVFDEQQWEISMDPGTLNSLWFGVSAQKLQPNNSGQSLSTVWYTPVHYLCFYHHEIAVSWLESSSFSIWQLNATLKIFGGHVKTWLVGSLNSGSGKLVLDMQESEK